MLDFLKNYLLTNIAIFIVMLAFAIKGVIDFYDWAKKRITKITIPDRIKIYRDFFNFSSKNLHLNFYKNYYIIIM